MHLGVLGRAALLCTALFFAAYAFLHANCGGSEGAPTVSILAPIVTKMAITIPSGGKSTITGQAGAAGAGNTIHGQNLTQEGVASSTWEYALWGIARAATSVQTAAATDGSFSMEIDANIGDLIRITQSDAQGNTSSPLTMTAPYSPLSLAFVPSDIAVDPDSAAAYVVGQSGGSGQATEILFGQAPAIGSSIALPAECSAPTAASVDGARDRLIVVDNTNGTVCAQPQGGGNGSLLSLLAVTPVNIAIHQDAAKAAITNNSGQVIVQVSLLDLLTDTFSSVNLPDPEGGAGQEGTPSVATGSSAGISYAIVVVSYVGGNDYAFVIDLNAASVIGSNSRLDVGSPREIRIYSDARGILVDGDGRAHILSIDVASGSVAILQSLAVGSDPVGVDIDGVASKAYVTYRGSDTLSVISLSSSPPVVLRTIDMADGPKQTGFKDAVTNQMAVIHNDRSAIVLSN